MSNLRDYPSDERGVYFCANCGLDQANGARIPNDFSYEELNDFCQLCAVKALGLVPSPVYNWEEEVA